MKRLRDRERNCEQTKSNGKQNVFFSLHWHLNGVYAVHFENSSIQHVYYTQHSHTHTNLSQFHSYCSIFYQHFKKEEADGKNKSKRFKQEIVSFHPFVSITDVLFPVSSFSMYVFAAFLLCSLYFLSVPKSFPLTYMKICCRLERIMKNIHFECKHNSTKLK